MRTAKEVIAKLPGPGVSVLDRPEYAPKDPPGSRVGLAVASMRDHMTDEGWQIFESLEVAGYDLAGYELDTHGGHEGPHTRHSLTNVREIVKWTSPGTLVLQDKREWDVKRRDFREPKARFIDVGYLKERSDIFKLTIVKDAQHNPEYHKESADEIGCHAWIIYYHPAIVQHLAPYLRPEHCIRTYHTIDKTRVPTYSSSDRMGCLISGAISTAYPLRKRLTDNYRSLPYVTVRKHPGYHRRGTDTYNFLQELTRYKVAICTSSVYGYALRKIIEATACGCIVITDLPIDDILPWIDGNLVRVGSNILETAVATLLRKLYSNYDPEKQAYFADLAKSFYDFRSQGVMLAHNIEQMRARYTK